MGTVVLGILLVAVAVIAIKSYMKKLSTSLPFRERYTE